MSSARAGLFALLLLALAGCAQRSHVTPLGQGPTRSANVRIESGQIDGAPALRVICPHYEICSTITDREVLNRMGELMEGAYGVYASLAPGAGATDGPMRCYLFASRAQWSLFTTAHTGDDASIYLRVNRGGYTVGDWYVAYWIGPEATASVAAHEGWHQYVARHLQGRLPPFLEEGLACLFEDVSWEGDLPRWDLSRNPARLLSLRSAVDTDSLYSLQTLARMHAGQVVGRRNAQIEAFYAESWAFARFLYDADAGRYRPALHQMLSDASRGVLYADGTPRLGRGPWWDPASSRPMLEHYLKSTLPRIESLFEQYVRELVRDAGPAETRAHFSSTGVPPVLVDALGPKLRPAWDHRLAPRGHFGGTGFQPVVSPALSPAPDSAWEGHLMVPRHRLRMWFSTLQPPYRFRM